MKSCLLLTLLFGLASCYGQTAYEISSTARSQTNTTGSTTIPTTTAGVTTTKKSRDLGRRRKWSYSELKEISQEQIGFYERARRSCEDGQFYNMELKTCSECIRYCPSKEDITNCGIECRGYYINMKLKEQNVRANEANATLRNITVVVSTFLILSLIVLVGAVYKIYNINERLAVLERMLRKGPTGDITHADPTESNVSLLSNSRQETAGEPANRQEA